MKREEESKPPEEPNFEYVVVEDEFNIMNEVFDELFEHIEKEIRQRI